MTTRSSPGDHGAGEGRRCPHAPPAGVVVADALFTSAPSRLLRLPPVQDPADGWQLDVQRVDRDGLVRLHEAVLRWRWNRATPLELEAHSSVLVVARAIERGQRVVRLDARGRLRIPRAWRRLHRARPGARLAVLTAPADGEERVLVELAEQAAQRLASGALCMDNWQ